MPNDDASNALAATLAPLTDLAWAAGDAAETARRLVALLPAGGAAEVPLLAGVQERAYAAPPGDSPADSPRRESDHGRRRKPSWFAWAILLLAMLAVAFFLKPGNEFEPPAPPAVQR
jgi:hypothetical protein